MTPESFVAKWSKSELKERSACQEHFLDLCRLVGHPTPAEADPTGESFCFERFAEKQGGTDGFADVWKKGFFAIEYKGKRKDLVAAYEQLLRYREDLENPPLLVVCDTNRLVIHTNFTNTAKRTYELNLANLPDPGSLDLLRAMFNAPDKLRPGTTIAFVSEEAARKVAAVAQSLEARGIEPMQAAQFLMKVIFALFAEDADLPVMLFDHACARVSKDVGNKGQRHPLVDQVAGEGVSQFVERDPGDPRRFHGLLHAPGLFMRPPAARIGRSFNLSPVVAGLPEHQFIRPATLHQIVEEGCTRFVRVDAPRLPAFAFRNQEVARLRIVVPHFGPDEFAVSAPGVKGATNKFAEVRPAGFHQLHLLFKAQVVHPGSAHISEWLDLAPCIPGAMDKPPLLGMVEGGLQVGQIPIRTVLTGPERVAHRRRSRDCCFWFGFLDLSALAQLGSPLGVRQIIQPLFDPAASQLLNLQGPQFGKDVRIPAILGSVGSFSSTTLIVLKVGCPRVGDREWPLPEQLACGLVVGLQEPGPGFLLRLNVGQHDLAVGTVVVIGDAKPRLSEFLLSVAVEVAAMPSARSASHGLRVANPASWPHQGPIRGLPRREATSRAARVHLAVPNASRHGSLSA